MRNWVGMLALGVALVGCTGKSPTTNSGDLTIKEAAAKVRALTVIVNGPNALANLNGKIQSESVANVVAAGGGNVIAAGGGNVIAAGGLNFRVQGSITTYTPVQKAFVYIEDALTGKAVGNGYMTDDNGSIQLKSVPDSQQVLSAIARFKLNGKDYRMAVPLAFGGMDKPVYADPINTVVEGRVRQILRDNGKANALSFQMLKDVWSVFNDADVNVDLSALENGKTLDDLFTFYNGLLDQLKSQDPDGSKAKVVKDYMASLKGTSN
jgi:hypothetical protein